MRNADLFSSNAPNLLKQATRHALTPSSIYFSAKQGNCDKKTASGYSHATTIGDLLINTVSFYALLERCDGTEANLKVAGSENDSNGQF